MEYNSRFCHLTKFDQLFTISTEEYESLERSDKESNHITKVLPTRGVTEKQSVVSVTAGESVYRLSSGSASPP